MSQSSPTPLEQMLSVGKRRRFISLGLPANSDPRERRFALTPEAVGMITAHGIEVFIESGAGESIHYPDARYAASGAHIVARPTALACDIVMHLSPMVAADVRMMRRGALLLTLLHAATVDTGAVMVMLERNIVSVALDLVNDLRGHRPFADMISEIDGRAAVTLAAAALADGVNGKGILLGGIAGIVPCEVTVIGAGRAGIAAASSALGMGAMVRMFDNDFYRLRQAQETLGAGVVGSALHQQVLERALRTADIVVATDLVPTETSAAVVENEMPYPDITSSMMDLMKKGALCYDITTNGSHVFPARYVDLASGGRSCVERADSTRVCYINPGAAVARTTAMALSNAFVVMLRQIVTCEGVSNAVKLNPGMQRGVFTFCGRLTNASIARRCAQKYIDITLLLQFS